MEFDIELGASNMYSKCGVLEIPHQHHLGLAKRKKNASKDCARNWIMGRRKGGRTSPTWEQGQAAYLLARLQITGTIWVTCSIVFHLSNIEREATVHAHVRPK